MTVMHHDSTNEQMQAYYTLGHTVVTEAIYITTEQITDYVLFKNDSLA